MTDLIAGASDSVQGLMSAGQTQQASQIITNMAQKLNQQAAQTAATVTEVGDIPAKGVQ